MCMCAAAVWSFIVVRTSLETNNQFCACLVEWNFHSVKKRKKNWNSLTFRRYIWDMYGFALLCFGFYSRTATNAINMSDVCMCNPLFQIENFQMSQRFLSILYSMCSRRHLFINCFHIQFLTRTVHLLRYEFIYPHQMSKIKIKTFVQLNIQEKNARNRRKKQMKKKSNGKFTAHTMNRHEHTHGRVKKQNKFEQKKLKWSEHSRTRLHF